MKSILLSVLLFPALLPAQNKIPEEKYRCIISADKEIYQPGESPKIVVEIKNNSAEPLFLAKALDGSDYQWRFPHAYFTITRIGDTSYRTKPAIRCGNVNDIRPADFADIPPGTTFNPYQVFYPTRTDNYYAFDNKLFNPDNFAQPGKYLIRFYYSTKENDFKKWRGRMYGREPDPAVYQEMLTLFAKVSRMEMVSNKLIIEVR